MNWPLSQDFNEAIQNPRVAFAEPDLKSAAPVVGPQGLPLPRSGNFADVYQLRGADGRAWAVKCFTRPVVGLAERYARVSEALARAGFPFTVEFTFLAEGIRIGNTCWPVVKMDWVEGLQLNQVVRENAAKPAVLEALLLMWCKLARRLREAGIAHADLQHGNVLLVPGARPGAYGLRLIDYDGMYVPALANQPSGEIGHGAYQHPARANGRVYSIDVDRFPHLVIAAALKGLEVVGPGLWERYDTGDNLLFTEEDFRAPGLSKVMRELWQTDHAAVQSFVGRLAISCTRPIPQTPWLDQLAPEGNPAPLTSDERRQTVQLLGLAQPTVVGYAVPGRTRDPALPDGQSSPLSLDVGEGNAAPRGTSGRTLRRSTVLAGLIIAALVALLGGVVAGVVLTGDRTPSTEGAREDAEGGRPQDGSATMSGDTTAKIDPIVSMPETTRQSKARSLDQLDPIEPPRAVDRLPTAVSVSPMPRAKRPPRARPAATLDLPLRWSAEFREAPEFAEPLFDLDGLSIVLAGRTRSEAVVLNARTGALRAELPATEFRPGGEPPVAIDGGVIAFRAANQRDLMLWDLNDGRITEVPHKLTKARSLVSLSANGRYVSIARRPSIPPAKSTLSPLEIGDTRTQKSVVAFDWLPGRVFYTPDSSRALVVDATDHFQWFRLPSGKLDGEWRFDREPSGLNSRVLAMSADGSLLLYAGAPPKQETGLYLLDGKTGGVAHAFPTKTYSDTVGFVAPNGSSVALLRTDGFGTASAVEILDTRGALVGKVRLPQRFVSIALSWESRTLALYSGDLRKFWVYDLPGGTTAIAVRPREHDPNAILRESVPDDDALAEAETILRQSLKAEYAKKSPADRRALAERLLLLARGPADDLAARFVMLSDARDLAVETQDPNLAIAAINELAKDFQIDGTAQMLTALERIVSATSNPSACRAASDAAASATEVALAGDEFEEAVRFAQLALNAARKGKAHPAVVDEAEARLAQARMARESFTAIRPALDVLRQAPRDAAANSLVGKYRCFVQGRWDDGLKHLTSGADPALRSLAELDLKATRAASPGAAIADRWWDYARTAPNDERWPAQARSRYWYQRLIPDLSGADKTRAEGRLGFSAGGVDYRPGLVCEITAKQPAPLKGKKTRVDRLIDFSGREFAEGGKPFDLSIKWTGAIAVPAKGHYTLSATTSDAVRVRLDNKTIIDTFTTRNARREAQVVLGERPVPLVVEFLAPATEQHRIKLMWEAIAKPGVELVPAECLFHDRRGEPVAGKSAP